MRGQIAWVERADQRAEPRLQDEQHARGHEASADGGADVPHVARAFFRE